MEDANLKKTLTFLVGLIMLILVMLLLTSCSTNDIELIYHADNYIFEIIVPVENLIDDYQAEIEKTSFLKNSYEENGKEHLLINMTGYNIEDPSSFISDVRTSLSTLLPQYTNVINSINYEIRKDFYGTSLSGTEYYHFSIVSTESYNVPIKIVCNKKFMFQNKPGTWNEKDNRYDLNTTITTSVEPIVYELEYITSTVKSGTIELDISTPSPSVKYRFYHESKDLQSLEYELKALGMTIEFCDSSQVIFYESYETVDDFNYVFPMRLFSMFGIVLTTEYKHSSFFTSEGEFNINVYECPSHLNVECVINSQDNTQFAITCNNKTESSSGSSTSFILDNNIQVEAQYTNARWFATITSMLVIVAIIMAMMCMIWMAKRH